MPLAQLLHRRGDRGKPRSSDRVESILWGCTKSHTLVLIRYTVRKCELRYIVVLEAATGLLLPPPRPLPVIRLLLLLLMPDAIVRHSICKQAAREIKVSVLYAFSSSFRWSSCW